jgi:8-oxo-dGTP pyrophosphatase MutT (NUDIX family)
MPAMLTTGGLRRRRPAEALDASQAPEHVATISYNGDFNMAGLLRHMHALGSMGASRDVIAINGDDEPVKFGWDGDGADKIISAEIDGVDALKSDSDAKDMTPKEFNDLTGGLLKFFSEESQEPEHVEDASPNLDPDDEPGPFDEVADGLLELLSGGPDPGEDPDGHFGAAVMYVEPDGRVLFLKRGAGEHAGHWDLPGGNAEDGENPEETAAREAKEESGIEPKNLKLVDKGPPLDGANKGYFATFASKTPRFIPKISGEHRDHLWADPARPPQPLHPGVAGVLDRFAGGMGEDAEDPPGGAADPDAQGGNTQPGPGSPDQNADPLVKDAFEESKHNRSSSGQFSSSSEGPGSSGMSERDLEDYAGRRTGGSRRDADSGGSGWSEEDLEDYGDKKPAALDSADQQTLYVMRPLLDPDKLVAWAQRAGFRDLLPAKEMHVTVAYSRSPVKWPKPAEKTVKITEGVRYVEKLGDKGAVVLRFDSVELSDRWREFGTLGATWDWDGYRPHVTLTYNAGPLMSSLIDQGEVEPFDGPLEFGPEEFAEVDDSWADKFKPTDMVIAIDSALRLAFDYADKPNRKYDHDGRLHVEDVNICREGISPYVGHEVPNWEKLGLEPDKIYKFYRPGDELKKAFDSSNGIPVLRRHKAVSAKDHDHWETVGSIGTRGAWDDPFVKNDISVWPAADIEGVESKKKTELSPGYHYKPVMEPGTFDGEDFDGRMTDIKFNHVAIVETGRQGPEITIGDSADDVLWQIVGDAISEVCNA